MKWQTALLLAIWAFSMSGVYAAAPIPEEQSMPMNVSSFGEVIDTGAIPVLPVTSAHSPLNILHARAPIDARSLHFDSLLSPYVSSSTVDMPASLPVVHWWWMENAVAERERLDKQQELLLFNLLPLPEPSGFLALGTGLAGLAGYAMRRRRIS